ncbi:MAG: hypothetical protein KDD98_08420 [Sphingomonadaceae bacterium]|nr:hypothetical protein [Sphingomonadaceae bacterium]
MDDSSASYIAPFRFLHDRQAEEFVPAIDGPFAAFRNDAHDLMLHASHTGSRIDPHHGGPEIDQLAIDIELGGRMLRWLVIDRNRKIGRYRLSSMLTRRDGALAIIVQREAEDGRVLTTVLVLHRQMEDQETRLPDYAGPMWDRVGEDVDGDGTVELLVPDQRFADAFGTAGKAPAPPLIYALQHGRFVEASRDGSYFDYFRLLEPEAAEACENIDGLPRSEIRAACYPTLAGLMARSGKWPAANQVLQRRNEDFATLDLPARAGGISWDIGVTRHLIAWGYLPQQASVRWWSKAWQDFYGEWHSGAVPFEVQMLVYDLQGCDHFSEEPAENPDGSVNEYVVDRQEHFCLRPIGGGDFVGVGDLRWDWIRGKYRDDKFVRELLENYDKPSPID